MVTRISGGASNLSVLDLQTGARLPMIGYDDTDSRYGSQDSNVVFSPNGRFFAMVGSGRLQLQIPSIDNSSAVSASTRMFWLYTRVACCLLRRSVSRGTLTIELSNFGGYITNLLSWE